MVGQPLRQPKTFWQWISGQEGTYYVPSLPKSAVLTTLEYAIELMHEEMADLRCDEYVGDNSSYHRLVDALEKLHAELIRRSSEESPDRNS